jgi:hypothetical protein
MSFIGKKPADVITSAQTLADGTVTPAKLLQAGPFALPANLTGGGGVVNFGSGQFYKDAIGNVGVGTASPTNIAGYKSVTVSSTTGGWVEVTNGTVRGVLQNGSGDVTLETRSAHPLIFGINAAERGRFDTNGNFLLGTTVNIDGRMSILANAGNSGCLTTGNNGLTTYYPGYFYHNGGLKGYISVNSSSTTYASISDYRLKENVQPMQNALARVAALKPVTYKWKADGSDGQGFIAHELQAVCPDAVVGEKDAVKEDGSIKPQGIDTSFLVATLTAAIQEQQAIITALTARVEALEGTQP